MDDCNLSLTILSLENVRSHFIDPIGQGYKDFDEAVEIRICCLQALFCNELQHSNGTFSLDVGIF